MALSNGPSAGIRDGQSLAEASATLFKDILLGRGSQPSDPFPVLRHHHHPPFRPVSSPAGGRGGGGGASYPLSLPPSLRFEDIQFLRSSNNNNNNKGGRDVSSNRGRLRRNSSLHSLWTAWDEAVSPSSSSSHSKRVISGVPGLGSSVSASVTTSKKPVPKRKKFSAPGGGTRHKVTFNLPAEEPPPCCCCCSCCSCCSSLNSNYSPPLSCCGPLLPPDLPPKETSSGSSIVPEHHYASPTPRDGDYSYAYDSSVSPAFLIKWREERDAPGPGGGDASPSQGRRENLYEEIVDVHEQIKKFSVSSIGKKALGGGSSSSPLPLESNSDSGIGNLVCSSGTLDMKKSLVQRANSFSSRDVYMPSPRISNPLPLCVNPQCPSAFKSSSKGGIHLYSKEDPLPASAAGRAGALSGGDNNRDCKTEGEETSPRIKGLFKRVLNKWSQC